ncbi:hypothetical protein [Rhodopirellula bahusiensis]|uniref:Uncharacterized protein n=1 Tax=Rhodopirellula bahusiensis TaxID=2014065 RepID=A0A2G1W6D2_9BACT|nr:hypothetical protein [Rhodopirellula bahusiensis]PHQ34578.1 hypothetical protein CEE69_14265 [Rhodopirellula bahusiensis]
MLDLILRDTDPEELRAAIVRDVVESLRSVLSRESESTKVIATREEMAAILKWSLSKLDQRTRDKTIPSLMDGDRRSYVIAEVIDALRANTAEEEDRTAGRQSCKEASRGQRSEAVKLCDYCHTREAVIHQFRNHDGFASVCEPCMQATIPPLCFSESTADFCCVTEVKENNPLASKSVDVGENDTRTEVETSDE